MGRKNPISIPPLSRNVTGVDLLGGNKNLGLSFDTKTLLYPQCRVYKYYYYRMERS